MCGTWVWHLRSHKNSSEHSKTLSDSTQWRLTQARNSLKAGSLEQMPHMPNGSCLSSIPSPTRDDLSVVIRSQAMYAALNREGLMRAQKLGWPASRPPLVPWQALWHIESRSFSDSCWEFKMSTKPVHH
jgi:hypothetical protein